MAGKEVSDEGDAELFGSETQNMRRLHDAEEFTKFCVIALITVFSICFIASLFVH